MSLTAVYIAMKSTILSTSRILPTFVRAPAKVDAALYRTQISKQPPTHLAETHQLTPVHAPRAT